MHLQIFHKVDPLLSLQSGVLWFTLAQIEEERKCSRAAHVELNGKAIKAKKQRSNQQSKQKRNQSKTHRFDNIRGTVPGFKIGVSSFSLNKN